MQGETKTGLTKRCPRCPDVQGEVFLDRDACGHNGEPWFVIRWNREVPGEDRLAEDYMLTAADLANPNFGCGYCGTKQPMRSVGEMLVEAGWVRPPKSP